jgi:DNA helicase-2/ATP-dependent DNA helicase PcrA
LFSGDKGTKNVRWDSNFVYLCERKTDAMSNYLDELNESQREAVTYVDGPSLVIAGAGSGKTRVLTYKIAHLLEMGYTPWSILALTFTNKAAREMKERIARQVGERARYLWMGTFHSLFSRILRMEASMIGFTPNFTIYDSSDSKSLLKSIIKEMQLDDKTYKPGVVQSRISNAKNHLILPDVYASNAEINRADMDAKMPAIRDIYRRYWERCRQSDAMDFDDLLVYTYVLFRDFPAVRLKYASQFQYVLVDEYQDTNHAQHAIVLQLTQEHQKVCVVGDDAQSIYSFRGANIDNILKFTKI